MKKQLHDARELIDDAQYEEAVALLCQLGPPEGAKVCELIAKAYNGRNRARGDVFTAKIFAKQAVTHGSEDPAMQEIIAAAERSDRALERPLKTPPCKMGGPLDTRPETNAPYSFIALSKLNGKADAPKDFQWLEKNIPCQKACPASTDIPGYLDAIYRGEHEKAYRINLECNVFPAVLGRVCARPCESECRHGWDGLGEPVAICFSKRSASDFGGQKPVVLQKWFPMSGKTVAVIGGGPAGLAAARQLALLGHSVTVYEKHSEPGGMMNQGIPVFRLPREIIEKEIDQIRALGVEIICNAEIGKSTSLSELTEQHDAVVLAAGTLRPNILNLPGKELGGIRHGLDFLLEVNTTGTTEIGNEVVVIGGGFTAMDCARTAKRLGANVKVCYRRSLEEMLVTPGELEELEHEGIPLETMVSPKGYIGKDGRVSAVQFVRTELGEPDASGRRRPVEMEGSEFEVPIDGVLLATGQFPDTTWIDEALKPKLAGDDGGLLDESGIEAFFSAGDFKNGANSLIDAIGHAKECAREVDQFLMGNERLKDIAEITDVTQTGRIREMDAVDLQPMPAIDLVKRDLTAEVETGFEKETSIDEAQRCYQCHYKFEIDSDKCIYCDWCVKAKPRPECILKIKKLQYDENGCVTDWEIAEKQDDVNLIWINQEDCIRCGACVAACPVDAISIQKVSLKTIVGNRTMEECRNLFDGVDPKNAQEILARAIDHFGDRITMATSFQLGGLVLLDMIHKLGKEIRIFSLDTGRLPEETYECSERIRGKYGISVDWVFPRHQAVQKLEKEKGLYSFKESIENRKECCGIRKVEPLTRALTEFDAWITGRRMDQSETRKELNIIEEDPVHPGRMKINPLVHWTKGDLWFYAEENKVPHNRLYDEGYLSIGCECCTRPCREGEDERDGRWWWEHPEHKECGLHLSSGAGI